VGCLFALITVLSPRLGLLLLWLFTNYVDRAFAGWLLPLLGLLFAPWTTLLYVLVDVAPGPIHIAGWILVGLGVMLDVSSYAQARRRTDA
jgi:putative Mn2+ efflux pump MntP